MPTSGSVGGAPGSAARAARAFGRVRSGHTTGWPPRPNLGWLTSSTTTASACAICALSCVMVQASGQYFCTRTPAAAQFSVTSRSPPPPAPAQPGHTPVLMRSPSVDSTMRRLRSA